MRPAASRTVTCTSDANCARWPPVTANWIASGQARLSASKAVDYATSLESLEESILNYPDYVLFDIDPYIYSGKEAKGAEPELNTVAFEKGKEVAFWLRELLLGMSLEPIVKTSGKTGLHVFVPIRRTIDGDTHALRRPDVRINGRSRCSYPEHNRSRSRGH